MYVLISDVNYITCTNENSSNLLHIMQWPVWTGRDNSQWQIHFPIYQVHSCLPGNIYVNTINSVVREILQPYSPKGLHFSALVRSDYIDFPCHFPDNRAPINVGMACLVNYLWRTVYRRFTLVVLQTCRDYTVICGICWSCILYIPLDTKS